MDENLKSEQLEEGEIVDDDDFEDISDNSIIEPAFGKFVSSNENLRALPLSSDSEIDKPKQIRHKRKLLHHKSKVKLRKRRKRVRLSSDSSDSDKSPPDDLKGKLKEAIRIADVDVCQKNPLQKRLKLMGGLVADEPAEPVTEELEPVPEPQKPEEISDKVDDVELENLRMEALKTAVINKFQRRKRKKAQLEAQETITPLQTTENKENNTPEDKTNHENENKVAVQNAQVDLDEDEDILRASLLAGLAKKIQKAQIPTESLKQVKKIPPKLPISVAPVLPKRPITKFKNSPLNKVVNKVVMNKPMQKVNRPKPQVKPLIIKLNEDSDTEDETKPPQTPTKLQAKVKNFTDITSNVEKFLKEQRAKFETTHKANATKDKTILEKSAVKLLPKSQQIEYQQLLKRLRNAERKKRAKKAPTTKTEPPKANIVTVEVQTAPVVKVEAVAVPQIEVVVQPAATAQPTVEPEDDRVRSPVISNTSAEALKTENSEVKSGSFSDLSQQRRARITQELTSLKRTLKEIKMQKNGRFQIQSKYQVLTSVIRKITSTSNERKKQEHRIKSLLQELGEAKNDLSKSHERFSTLVRELLSKKEEIDKSYQDKNVANGKITNDAKPDIRKDTKLVTVVTSTPIKAPFNEADEATISTFISSSTNNECEDMDVCNSDETDIGQIDIVDPNDIDQIFKRKTPVKSTIPEYVSPLDFNAYERYKNVDPHGIMCPYEVNGSCRDIDCTYKHYLKNHERR